MDTVIVPSTWFEVGAGVHGEIGDGLRYRALRAGAAQRARVLRRRRTPRRAAERGGGERPQRRVRGPCWSTSACAVCSSGSAAGMATRASRCRGSTRRCWVAEADARYRRGRTELRAQYAHVGISDARPAERGDRAHHRRVAECRARAARVLRRGRVSGLGAGPGARPGASSPATRTSTPSSACRRASSPLEEFDRTAWIAGATYYPDPDVAIKIRLHHVRRAGAASSACRAASTSALAGGSRSHVASTFTPSRALLCVACRSWSPTARRSRRSARSCVEAERFNFTPSRIKLTVGEEIELHLRSADTSHGFQIEGTDINVEIPKRGKGEMVVRYKATAAGRFTLRVQPDVRRRPSLHARRADRATKQGGTGR